MTPSTFITIIVPTLNEEAHIARVLEELRPKDEDYEIIVVDGGSSDETRSIVSAIAKSNPHVRLIDNPDRLQAAGVNAAAKAADPRSTHFVRADAHCRYPADFARRVLHAMVTMGATSAVVPMNTVGDETLFQSAAAAAQNSRLGNGGSRHRRSDTASSWIDHGHHAGFDRAFFLANGGYDTSFTVNEDAEYDIRTASAGAKVWMCGDLAVDYFPRVTPSSLARQYFNHGRGRAKTLLKHKARPKLRQLASPLAFLGVTAGFIGALATPIGFILPATYLGLIGFPSWWIARKQGLRSLDLLIALVVMHMAWGAGFSLHLFRNGFRKSPAAATGPA